MFFLFEVEMEVLVFLTFRFFSFLEFADEDILFKYDLRKGVENYNSMVRDVIECGWL